MPTIWPLEPHTAAKHAILQGYLGAWLPIMSKWEGRLLILDGFAGPGLYAAGEPGSPKLTLETLLAHRYDLGKNNCEFVLAFNEADPERFAYLEREVGAMGAAGWPDHVKVHLFNENFQHLADGLVKGLEERGRKLAPTFAFLDPFGYEAVPMDLIRRLLAPRKSELFIYFDYNSVQRWANKPGKVEHLLTNLFGTDSFMQAPPAGDSGRKGWLRDLYGQQLKDACGFPHVRWFEMRDKRNKTVNYMFYATRHIIGLSRMKDVMWKVAPSGDFAFSDYLNRQPVLFTPEPDLAPLRQALLNHFVGAKATIEQVIEYTVVHTPYAESHVKKQTLKPMQEAGLIEVTGQKRRGTFPEGTEIVFS